MVSPSPGGAGHFAALRGSILSASASRKAGERKRCEIAGDLVGIGDDAVAHPEGALGGFHDAVDVLEAFGLLDAQAVEQRQDDERGQPLRRRRRVIERARFDAHAERRIDPRAVLLEIGAGDRAAETVEVGGNLAADIAAIEIVEAGVRQMIEGGGERALLEVSALLRRLAVDQKCLGETGRVFQLIELFDGEPRLAARHRIAVARVLDGAAEQYDRAATCRRRPWRLRSRASSRRWRRAR